MSILTGLLHKDTFWLFCDMNILIKAYYGSSIILNDDSLQGLANKGSTHWKFMLQELLILLLSSICEGTYILVPQIEVILNNTAICMSIQASAMQMFSACESWKFVLPHVNKLLKCL